MRHLPARGRQVSRSGGGAGLPIGLGATGAGRGPEGPMSTGRRGALGWQIPRGTRGRGEGLWRSMRAVLNHQVGCPLCLDWRQAGVGQRVGVGYEGQQRQSPLLLASPEGCEEEVLVGRCSPYIPPSGYWSGWGSAQGTQYNS